MSGKIIASVLAIVMGLCGWAYWFLFMSWSHSSPAPDFQHRELAVQVGSTALIVTGFVFGASPTKKS